jgi:hypothetical protein
MNQPLPLTIRESLSWKLFLSHKTVINISLSGIAKSLVLSKSRQVIEFGKTLREARLSI